MSDKLKSAMEISRYLREQDWDASVAAGMTIAIMIERLTDEVQESKQALAYLARLRMESGATALEPAAADPQVAQEYASATETPSVTVRKMLREARKQMADHKNLASMQTVADAIGIPLQTLGHWENGTESPTWEQFDRWWEVVMQEREA